MEWSTAFQVQNAYIPTNMYVAENKRNLCRRLDEHKSAVRMAGIDV